MLRSKGAGSICSTAPLPTFGLIPLGPHVVGDALTNLVAVVEPSLANPSGLSARQPVTAAGVAVEPLALPKTRLWSFPALAQAGVGVQRLISGTICGANAAAQIVIPRLASRAKLPISWAFALAFTGVVVQFPAWTTAVFGESVLTDALAGRVLQNPVGPTKSQEA